MYQILVGDGVLYPMKRSDVLNVGANFKGFLNQNKSPPNFLRPVEKGHRRNPSRHFKSRRTSEN